MDNGVLVCLDGKTGEEQYRQRLGGDCNSSPIASDGRIYASNNDGTTFVVEAGRAVQVAGDERVGREDHGLAGDLGRRVDLSDGLAPVLYRPGSHGKTNAISKKKTSFARSL